MTTKRGFAAMTPERRKEVSSKGGKKAHELGTAHQWTSAEAKEAVAKRVAVQAVANEREPSVD